VDNLLSELQAILHQQIELHGALGDELEQEAARDGELDSNALIGLQIRKNRAARGLRELERRRLALVRTLAAEWAEPAEALTLRRIIPRAGELGPTLQACHAQLVERVERVRHLARVTSGNAQARLKAVDATLAVIGEAIRLHPTYSDAGRLHKVTPTLKVTSA